MNNYSIRNEQSFSLIYYHTKMDISPQLKEKTGCSHILLLLKEKKFWIVGASIFCFGMIREGFLAWMSDYLSVNYKIISGSNLSSISALSFTLGSFLGAFLSAGISTITYFKKNKVIMSLFFYVLLIVIFIMFYYVHSQIFAIILIGCLSLCVYGIQGYVFCFSPPLNENKKISDSDLPLQWSLAKRRLH